MKLDFFAENVTFHKSKGSLFTSNFGAALSVTMMIIVAVYSSNRLTVMLMHEGSS